MSLVFNKVVSTDLDLQSQKSATDESNSFPCQDIRTARATVTAEQDSSDSVTAQAGSLGDISNISLHSALYHVLQRIAFTLTALSRVSPSHSLEFSTSCSPGASPRGWSHQEQTTQNGSSEGS